MKNRQLNSDIRPNRAALYAERSRLQTLFWKNAAASLPASVRARYMLDIEHAERMELAVDGVFEILARVKALFSRGFSAPRGAH